MVAVNVMRSQWEISAEGMLKNFGYVEARRLCIKWRDMAVKGVNRDFHAAVLAHLEKLHREEENGGSG